MINRVKNKEIEEFKYLIDSRKLSKKDKKINADKIIQARAVRLRERSEFDIKRARLMQLKLQMEEYLNVPNDNSPHSFSDFLRAYIDIIYNKRKDFAEDLSVEPLMLSQVLNNHREPQEKFMLRLMVHSDRTFAKICEFNQKIWYRIYYKEKVGKIMSTQKNWRGTVEKFVTNRKLETEF